ncbi:MAG: methyltransferase domain-containing protein [Chloroflexia bacterium]|nr:methyltransferase domain-containing protein [Chloroflexia bacterium]
MVLELAIDVIAAKNRDALTEQLLGATRGVWDIFTVYLGDQLGLYQALSEIEPATAGELAAATGTHERYVREWLEQQTVAGILDCENSTAEAADRRFALPAGHAEVLVERDNLNYLAPLAQITAGAVFPIHTLLGAFRNGGGVPYEDYGADLREGQAGMNRNLFLQQLGTEYLPAIPDLDARLRAEPPARVADIGCGVGWSSIGIANAYPMVLVDGFDLDEASVVDAQPNVREARLTDRVRIEWRDAGDPTLAGRYDLVTAFECIHDMSDPVSVLRTMRRLTAPGGSVLVMDERVSERFRGEGNDVEWFMYGFSVLHCLPVGMADQPSVGTGTVMRPSTLQDYALEAGFREVELLPLANYFFNFYRLTV